MPCLESSAFAGQTLCFSTTKSIRDGWLTSVPEQKLTFTLSNKKQMGEEASIGIVLSLAGLSAIWHKSSSPAAAWRNVRSCHIDTRANICIYRTCQGTFGVLNLKVLIRLNTNDGLLPEHCTLLSHVNAYSEFFQKILKCQWTLNGCKIFKDIT